MPRVMINVFSRKQHGNFFIAVVGSAVVPLVKSIILVNRNHRPFLSFHIIDVERKLTLTNCI